MFIFYIFERMKVLGVIPARYGSTRFPGKPLVDIDGKSMIQRVYEQCSLVTSLSSVVVATDDSRILDHVLNFGGKAVMTDSNHRSGTDRCAEVVHNDLANTWNIVVNIQGDEPYVKPEQINALIDSFKETDIQIATLIKKIETEEELFNPNIPKVITNIHKEAIYFSRHPIPFQRNADREKWLQHYQYFKHIGIYAYRTGVLKKITQLSPSPLEITESLEQLRWIEHGYKIKTEITEHESVAIDTPEDLKKLLNLLGNK